MNLTASKSKTLRLAAIICLTLASTALITRADTFTLPNTISDAFLANGPSTNLAANNYGGAGTLALAPASSTKGQFDSVIKFNTASAVSQFDTTYGVGGWIITGLTLKLASNAGTEGGNPGNGIFNTIHGGLFGINWIANDSWVEGSGNPMMPGGTGVNFNSRSSLLAVNASLGTYTYTPPGNNIYVSYNLTLDTSLVADAVGGGDVSLYFYAADEQISYLFNSRSSTQPNNPLPQLTLTAAPVPEPATMSLLALSLGGVLGLRKLKRKS